MTIGSDLRNGDSNIWTLLDCYEELCNEIHTFIFVPVHIQLFASVSSTLVFEVHFTSLQIRCFVCSGCFYNASILSKQSFQIFLLKLKQHWTSYHKYILYIKLWLYTCIVCIFPTLSFGI